MGSPLEYELTLFAISQILERFLVNCRITAVRDRIEDLLNVAHRRAALLDASRTDRGQTPSTDAGPVTGASDTAADDEMFGLPWF